MSTQRITPQLTSGSMSRRNTCRLCDSADLRLAVPLNPSPIADAFVTSGGLGVPQDSYPLDLYLCVSCGHIQNLDIINPNLLFRDYLFTTGSSEGLQRHFSRYATDLISDCDLSAGSLVVEVGSNDGTLLSEFKQHGMRVVGIDPATEIAALASARGIPTINDFLTVEIARRIRLEHGSAQLVCANNVFAHADDLVAMVEAVRELLADSGLFVFEATYLVDLVDKMLFDTVYHEHVSYHSVGPLVQFFRRYGMELINVTRNSSKGGSIRGYAQLASTGQRSVHSDVAAMIENERRRGFDQLSTYENYSKSIEERKKALADFVTERIGKDVLIAGYGASTTTTTLMWNFELTRTLSFIVDDNVKKHGLYAPGCHVPVVPSTELYVRRPDFTIVLAWQYAEAIINKHAEYLAQGGKFVVPLPVLSIIG
jgi:SAM-dependent methyltransferase